MSIEPRLKRIESLERRAFQSTGTRIRLNLLRHGGYRKLDEERVRQIKQWLAEGVLQTEIARRTGRSQGTISNIAVGTTWSWVRL